MIRALRPTDERPAGVPRRYPASNGYIRLRWTVAPCEQVEIYEHRWVAERKIGRPLGDDEHVHHVDHDCTNNDPDNLEVLTQSEHRRRHAEEQKVDDELICSLYLIGYSTPVIGSLVGCDAGTVSRVLQRNSVPARTIHRYVEIDEDEVERLHGAGVRARAIARRLGVSATTVERVFRERGLKPFKTGRPAAQFRTELKEIDP